MRAAPRASRIRLLVLDVDGVLTDGGLLGMTLGLASAEAPGQEAADEGGGAAD